MEDKNPINTHYFFLFSHFGNIKFRQIKPWSPQIVSYSKEIFLNTLSAFKRSLAALIFSWKYSFNYLIAICYHFSKSRWHILFNKPRAFRVLQTPWLSFPFGFHLWIRSQSAKYYSLCNSLSQRLSTNFDNSAMYFLQWQSLDYSFEHISWSTAENCTQKTLLTVRSSKYIVFDKKSIPIVACKPKQRS